MDLQNKPMISPAYLSVFTRVLIQCPETFDAVLEEVAKVMDTSPVNTVIGFMEFWLDQVQHETAQPLLMSLQMDRIGRTPWNKLSALALGAILTNSSFHNVFDTQFLGIFDRLVSYLTEFHVRDDSISEVTRATCLLHVLSRM